MIQCLLPGYDLNKRRKSAKLNETTEGTKNTEQISAKQWTAGDNQRVSCRNVLSITTSISNTPSTRILSVMHLRSKIL